MFSVSLNKEENYFVCFRNLSIWLNKSKLLNMEENLSGYDATIENEEGSLDNIPKAAEYQPPALQE